MTMTAQDIQSQQFHVRFRGFDVDEVDAFLEKVAENFLILSQEHQQLKEQLEASGAEVSTYRQQEKSFQKAIISAQQIADEMKRQSEEEAAALIENARRESQELRERVQQECDELRALAHAEIAALEQQLDALKEKKQAVRSDLRQTLETYLASLDESFGKPPAEAAPTTPLAADAGMAPPVLPASRIVMAQEHDDDLADLYQKIDLSDDLIAPVAASQKTPDVASASDGDGDDAFSLDDIPADETLPDLEGDMLFTLDDPLDDLTPEIRIKKNG